MDISLPSMRPAAVERGERPATWPSSPCRHWRRNGLDSQLVVPSLQVEHRCGVVAADFDTVLALLGPRHAPRPVGVLRGEPVQLGQPVGDVLGAGVVPLGLPEDVEVVVARVVTDAGLIRPVAPVRADVGNDSRDNYFNVLGQGERYDSDADYITHWLPELDGLPTEYAHRPWRLSEREQAEYGVQIGIDYPAPMLDIEEWYRMH